MSDIQFIMLAIATIILSPAVIIITIVFWKVVGHLLNMLLDKIYPPDAPYCDIDPRCHQAFVWRSDGTGWIGNIRVIRGHEDGV